MDEFYVVTAWEDGIPVVATLTAGGIGEGIDASVDIDAIVLSLAEISNKLNGQISTIERVTSYSIGSTTTAATGTNWVALAAGATNNIAVRNRAATSIDIRKFGETEFLTLANGDDVTFPTVANSNEWEIKRTDSSNTPVVIKFLRYS